MADREQYKQWVIDALKAAGGSQTVQKVYKWVERNCPVPKADLEHLTKDGKDLIFQKHLRWARKDLLADGIIDGSVRGVWRLK